MDPGLSARHAAKGPPQSAQRLGAPAGPCLCYPYPVLACEAQSDTLVHLPEGKACHDTVEWPCKFGAPSSGISKRTRINPGIFMLLLALAPQCPPP